jgi:hypothetical protein
VFFLRLSGVDPSGASGRQNDQAVHEIPLGTASKKWQQDGDCISMGGWVDFQPNHSGVLPKRQDRPISEMLVQGDEDSAVGYGPLNDLRIVGTILPHLRGSHHIITFAAKGLRHFDPQALV